MDNVQAPSGAVSSKFILKKTQYLQLRNYKPSQKEDFGSRSKRNRASTRRHTKVCRGVETRANTEIGIKDFFEIASNKEIHL